MIFTLIIFVALFFLFFIGWRVPPAALGVILCMFGIEQFAQSISPFFVQHASLINLFVGFLGVIALYRRHRRSGLDRLYLGGVGLLAAAIYLYAAFSTLWSPISDFSLKYFVSSAPYIFLYVVIAPLLVVSTRDLEKGLEYLVYIGMAASILLLFFAEWDGRGVVVAGNEGADWSTANPLASSEMAGYVALAAILMPGKSENRVWEFLRWATLVISILLAVKSGSRGQSFFMLLSLAIFFPLRRKFSAKSLAAIAVPAILAGLAFQYALDSYWEDSDRWSEEGFEEAITTRGEMAGSLLQAWWRGGGQVFLFGLGNSASFDPDIAGSYPHVVPLEILGEEGLVGFLMYIALLALVIRSFVITMGMNSARHRELAIALAAMFLYSFLLSLKQGSLLGTASVFLFASLLGRWRHITAMSIIRRRKKRASEAGPNRDGPVEI